MAKRGRGRSQRGGATESQYASGLRLCRIVRNMDSGRRSTPRRILAIDDDPVSLAVAVVLLESEECAVVQAESGEDALELLEAAPEKPDCIVADLRMPSLSGPELAVRLRAAAPEALLLAMSATPPETVEGYDGVLKKPLSAEAVSAAFADRTEPGGRTAAGGEAVEGAGMGDAGGPGEGYLDEAVFDRLRRAMPLAALDEVITAFLEDTGMRIELMRSADGETLRREAHTVKGGAAMVGAIRVASVASAIEAGIDHHGNRRDKLDELELCLRRSEVILKERLKI
ncbi:MAG TPA: response regulator [Acidobacteriaceae bacterium]|jgi:CheY-like chemotaxis protein|nr:response regulator [Acidobacteriaceae bacterium]